MALARPYFDRGTFSNWTHDQLVSALIEARTVAMSAQADCKRWKDLAESREEPWI